MQIQRRNNIPELWGGIECTINRVQHTYHDQLNYSGHYQRPSDISLFAEVGIKKIRYPVLWEKHQPNKETNIDWEWTRNSLETIKKNGIEIIAGLVHHGSGPVFTNLSDDNFPVLLADYARQVAKEFPWIKYYTPINEPLTTARFSGLYGLWFPHKTDDHSFLKMLLNELKGTVLAMQAIQEINPQAQLVQTEDLGKTYSTPALKYQADFENHRRWLTFDLLCGLVNKQHPLWNYFITNKIYENELEFFLQNPCIPAVFGFNHYLTSERFLDDRLDLYPQHLHGGNGTHRYVDVEAVRMELNEESGISVLLKEAWQRYKKPIAVTEVHLHCHREDQLRWFKHVWKACNELKEIGIDIRAVTAWAMLGSFGWNNLLTQPGGDYEAGVFDVRNGTPRPTALAHFIKSINQTNKPHFLSADKGWWQRSTRFIHAPVLWQNHVSSLPENNAPILIIGKNGTLGRAFARLCKERVLSFKLVSRQECNICDEDSLHLAIETYRPWAMINAAGFVRVDEAETERKQCYDDNTLGPQTLAKAASKFGIKLISFSSDLVFNGAKASAYLEDDKVNPLNFYGHSKAEAERLIITEAPESLVIRTSAFFSPWDQYNFVHYVRRSLLNGERIQVANDAVISPTYVPDLVNATLDLLIDDEKGIWHLANGGELTWADLANEIADRFDLNRKYIQEVSTADLNFPATRPLYSALSSNRGVLLPSLEHALKRYTNDSKSLHKECITEFRA